MHTRYNSITYAKYVLYGKTVKLWSLINKNHQDYWIRVGFLGKQVKLTSKA